LQLVFSASAAEGVAILVEPGEFGFYLFQFVQEPPYLSGILIFNIVRAEKEIGGFDQSHYAR